MTIASTTNRVSYTGNGAVATYSYTYKIFADTDLLVTVKDTGGVETTLTKTTHYTVTGAGAAAGGSITLLAGFSWMTAGFLTTGYTLVIRRSMSILQPTDIRNQGAYYPEGIEDQFDRGIMIDLQEQNLIDRAVKLPESVDPATFSPTLPSTIAAQAGKAMIVNSAGTGFDFYAIGLNTSLSPLSTKGDLATYDTAATRLPVGINDSFLIADSAQAKGIKWGSIGTTLGDVLVHDGVKMARLALGSNGALLGNLGTSVGYMNIPAVLNASMAAATGTSSSYDVTVKTAAAATPSASSPVYIPFRNGTATTGTLVWRSVTAALTINIPSGATLGLVNAQSQYLYVYAVDNAGTVVLAVAGSRIYDESALQSTTAIGAGSTSNNVLYAVSALSTKPVKYLGRVLSTQATAGTWVSSPTEVSMDAAPKAFRSFIYLTGANGFGSTNTTCFRYTTVVKNLGADMTLTQDATNGDFITINTPGAYGFTEMANLGSAGHFEHGITKNGNQLTTSPDGISLPSRIAIFENDTGNQPVTIAAITYCDVGDVIRFQGTTNATGTRMAMAVKLGD